MRHAVPKLAIASLLVGLAMVSSGCSTIFAAQSAPKSTAGLAPKGATSTTVLHRPGGGGLGGLLRSLGVHLPANPASASSPIQPPSQATGALNAAVTQANVMSTICSATWAPPPQPSPVMVHQFEALEIGKGGTVVYEGTVYKVPGLNEIDPTLSQFRVDHLVPLDLGGAASDPRNLWVEPLEAPAGQAPVGMGAQTKIRVDHYLHQMVCSGHMKLQAAQEGIINDWAQFIGAKVSS